MSIISINHLCRDIIRDASLRQAFLCDPAAALTKYPRAFTEEERKALLAGDVGSLYRAGVNAYLLGYLARYGIFGLTAETYSARVRAAAGEHFG
jgi:Aromatic-ring-opening dioxygenase LigAB, LigA subunit